MAKAKKETKPEVATVSVDPTSWKNESEDGTVVETTPAQLVCQNCEGGLVVNSVGVHERCPVCEGTGLLAQ